MKCINKYSSSKTKVNKPTNPFPHRSFDTFAHYPFELIKFYPKIIYEQHNPLNHVTHLHPTFHPFNVHTSRKSPAPSDSRKTPLTPPPRTKGAHPDRTSLPEQGGVRGPDQGETADMGHRGPGEVQERDARLLQGRSGFVGAFRALHLSLIGLISALLLLYDVTNKSSFDNIRAWLGEIREYAQDDVVIMLIGEEGVGFAKNYAR